MSQLDINILTFCQGNHPLLCQARFSDDEYGIIVDAMRVVRSDFAQSGRERCLGFVKEMHDYELVGQVIVAECGVVIFELRCPSKFRRTSQEIMKTLYWTTNRELRTLFYHQVWNLLITYPCALAGASL